MGARGNSGVILAQILRGICDASTIVASTREGSSKGLARGAELAYEAMLTPVEGTMLTVARAAADAVADVREEDCSTLLDAAARAAHEALERTPELLPLLKQSGVVDAGGMGLCVVLDAFAASVAGRPLPVAPRTLRPVVRQREAGLERIRLRGPVPARGFRRRAGPRAAAAARQDRGFGRRDRRCRALERARAHERGRPGDRDGHGRRTPARHLGRRVRRSDRRRDRRAVARGRDAGGRGHDGRGRLRRRDPRPLRRARRRSAGRWRVGR